MAASDTLSIAPMIQWTDRHWRYFFRGISRQTLLYSEMLVANALYYNAHQLENFVGHHAEEHPLAIQLGGNNPARLGDVAYLVQQYRSSSSQGFQEINLNAGCPSNKAKKQGYGAELMVEPSLIREILHDMVRKATSSEISIKCRLGVMPGPHSFDDLCHLMREVEASGVRKVVLHARMCQLHGLSPAQNRTIPPLHPELVHRLVALFPTMRFVLNGGIQSVEQASQHLTASSIKIAGPSDDTAEHRSQWYPPVHGVMIGRAAYHHPFDFSAVDSLFYQDDEYVSPSRREVLERYLEYADHAMDNQSYNVTEEERNVHRSSASLQGCPTGCFTEDEEINISNNNENTTNNSSVQFKSYGNRCCTIIKPLHHFFHGSSQNGLYKQRLDQQILQYSKQVDKGFMTFSDMIWPVIQECVDAEFLEKRGV